jgi:hypothetical protein
LSLKVEIDSSYLEVALNFIENSTRENLVNVIQHQAAKDIYDNAFMFNATAVKIDEFWKTILLREKEKGKDYIENIFVAQNYITEHRDEFINAFNEIKEFIPRETNIECKLYLMFGYDLGIANERNALINLGHPLYHEFNRELLYFSMHELHHVVFFNYQPIRTLDEIKTTSDLLSLIKFLTHLEGLATYLTLNKRIKEKSLTFKDYKVLTNKKETNKITREYFDVLNKITEQPDRIITKEDFTIFKKMSGGPRLWYITGGHMAKLIDEMLGRDVLIQTIIDGSDSFFKQYNKVR